MCSMEGSKMAHLNYHGKVIRVYKANHSELRYHITDTDKVMKTLGPRLGKCKVVKDKATNKMVSAEQWEARNFVALTANFTKTIL